MPQRPRTKGSMIQIIVNGEPTQAPDGQTVLGLLESLGIDPAKVAVEINRRIVKQNQWAGAQPSEGASLEIVQFVGGG